VVLDSPVTPDVKTWVAPFKPPFWEEVVLVEGVFLPKLVSK
jgi:hypothetical protein